MAKERCRAETFVWILACVLLPLWLVGTGCRPEEPQPELLAARFDDSNLDGQPQSGERIVLSFSGPVSLGAQPARNGVRIHGLRGGPLGTYRVLPGASDNQLEIELGRGSFRLEVDGHYSGTNGASSGLSLNFQELDLRTARGTRLSGDSQIVDLARSIQPPALLEAAEWVDLDGDFSVSEGDKILLQFDRPVALGDSVKQRGFQLPPSMFQLPVPGDRFDDGESISTLLNTPPSQVAIVLGSRPRLTVQGSFDLLRLTESGAPSGLAISGTRIRPHQGIRDRQGGGVASRAFIDLGGDSSPFRPLETPLSASETTFTGHTLTTLPEGKVMLIGGLRTAADEFLASDEVWLFDGQNWTGPATLKQPRFGHTATYFLGADARAGTLDDFVVVVGGYDGNKPLRSMEVVFPQSDGIQIYPIYDHNELSQRFYHTAHAVDEQQLVLVGGQIDRLMLNARVEAVDLEIRWAEQDPEPRIEVKEARSYGTLLYPRVYHDSCVLRSRGRNQIFVFGGWGTSNEQSSDQVAIPTNDPSRTIRSQPELFSLHNEISINLDPAAEHHDKRRWGHRIIPLDVDRENPELLIVGGTTEAPFKTPGALSSQLDCRQAFRVRVDMDRFPPELSWELAGELAETRHSFGVARLADGKILLLGGVEGGAPSDRVEVFSPRWNDFAPFSANLAVPRESPRVAPLDEHRWLIIGGNDGGAQPVEMLGRE